MATRQWIFFATICLLTVGVLIACGPETAPVTSTSSESQALTDTPTVAMSDTVDLGVVPFLVGETTGGENRPGFNQSTVPVLDEISLTPYQLVHTPEGTDSPVRSLFDWSPDGRYFLADRGSDEVIQIGSLGYEIGRAHV